MVRFKTEAELTAFLGKLNPNYAQYAAALWQKESRTSWQLEGAREHILLSAGLSELHIDGIKASIGGVGELMACNALCQPTCCLTRV